MTIQISSSIRRQLPVGLAVLGGLVTRSFSPLAVVEANQTNGCSICVDASPPNGTDCPLVEHDLYAIPMNSSQCREAQLQGFTDCNCPTFPSDQFCALCDHGYSNLPNVGRMIPFLNLACITILFGDVTVKGECQSYSRAASYCGCPNATRSDKACTLCGSTTTMTSSERNNNVPETLWDRRIPPTFLYTCQDYEDAASMFQKGDCSALSEGIPVDLPAFCGCSVLPDDTNSTTSCALCGDENEIRADTIVVEMGGQTCAQVATLAVFVTDSAYCTDFIQPLRRTCCEATGPTISPAPVVQRNLSAAPSPTLPVGVGGRYDPDERGISSGSDTANGLDTTPQRSSRALQNGQCAMYMLFLIMTSIIFYVF